MKRRETVSDTVTIVPIITRSKRRLLYVFGTYLAIVRCYLHVMGAALRILGSDLGGADACLRRNRCPEKYLQF